MDLEDDTHMSTYLGTTTVQEVINVPIMISPDIYNQVAELVIKKLEENPGYHNLIDAKISAWMDRNFDLSDYNTDGIKEDILDAVRYDLRNSIRAEVEIFVD
jgi:hypothetical protein